MFVFSQILAKNISQIINWAAFLQNIKRNKIFFQATRETNTIMKRSNTFAIQKIYSGSKNFSQNPVILHLFNLKIKVKLPISRNCYNLHKQLYIQEVTGKFIIPLTNITQFNIKLLNSISIKYPGIN